MLNAGFFGVRLTGQPCPFKLFRRTVFDHMPLQSHGDFVHSEVVARPTLGSLLAEVPVEFHRTEALRIPIETRQRQIFRAPTWTAATET